MSDEVVVTVNVGSSSLRCSLFELQGDAAPKPLHAYSIRGLPEQMIVEVRDLLEETTEETELDVPEGLEASQKAALNEMLTWLESCTDADTIAAFAHRIVHGGTEYAAPVLLDAETVANLEKLTPLAPSHQPHNLRPVHMLRERYPDARQVGCFDTAFHRTQQRLAQLFALPRHLTESGIVRYGFHGLSYEHIASRLASDFPDLATGRVIVAHLGQGVSMCALKDGASIATTMGLTALDGLPMGQRCGALDPGVVLHLVMERGYDPAEVKQMLYEQSGLLGVSGVSGEMITLLDSDSPDAQEAIDLFAYRCEREFGSLAAALRGVDAVVLTGGMGTHLSQVRARLAAQLEWLGITFDPDANERGDTVLSTEASTATLLTLPTDEEDVLARAAAKLLAA